MSDILVSLAALYGFGALIVFAGGVVLADNASKNDDRRKAARVALLSPLWPLMTLGLLAFGLIVLLRWAR